MKYSAEAVRGDRLEAARCDESNEVLKIWWWIVCDEVVAGREIIESLSLFESSAANNLKCRLAAKLNQSQTSSNYPSKVD